MSAAPRETWLLVVGWELHHPGGVSQVVSNLIRMLQRYSSFEPVLMVNSWSAQKASSSANADYRTIYAALRAPLAGSSHLLALIKFVLFAPLQILRLRRVLRDERVRVVNAHYPGLDAWLWLLTKPFAPEFRLILSLHGTDARGAAASRGLERRLWRGLLRRADCVVTCSDDLPSLLADELGVPAGKFQTIDNGVDPELIESISVDQPAWQPAQPFILALGTIDRIKGHDILVRAFGPILRAYSQLHLVIAGRSTPGAFPELELARAEVHSPDRVHFLPDLAHAEAMRLLRHALLLALPSRQEAFGIVVLEAGVLGKPVVATDRCGATHRLRIGAEVVSVPGEEPEALAAAILGVMADPVGQQRLGDALRARVLRDFTWRALLGQYLSLANTTRNSPVGDLVPDVTVGLPVYNGGRFLRRAISSILAQTYTNFELLIYDNASTDDSVLIAEEFAARDNRIQIVRHPRNIGAARNWNSIVPRARGAYFKWASSNDYVAPTMLEECVSALESDETLVLCTGRTTLVRDDGTEIGEYDGDVDAMQRQASKRFTHISRRVALNNLQGGVIRTDALRRTSLERVYPGGDLVFVAELALHGRFRMLERPLFFRRLGAQSSTTAMTDAALRTFWDPAARNRHATPMWRLQGDYLQSVLDARLGPVEKARALATVARHALWQRAALGRELGALLRGSRENHP
jgi:glycosyltransferase involved in cell wall biosynthesis